MATVYPTRTAVRDSIDDDDLTDIDDEVFIRDGRNGGIKLDDDGGVKRPLMAPRRKCKKSCNFESHRFPCKALFVPFCYGFTALIVLLGLIVLCIFTANIFSMPLTMLKNWISHELKSTLNKSDVIPCTSLVSKVVWTRTLPKFTSEAPLRSNDVNKDGIQDIIVGFSTGLDTMDTPEYICTLYFGNQVPCLGGILALNGKTGETIWTHWTAHAIFSVDCGLDLTGDKIKECIISGRGGILHAVNGHDGTSVWEIPIQDPVTLDQQKILDVYDAKFIADVDGDNIGDVITSHAMQSGEIRSSEILMISGKTGDIIHRIKLPDTEQLFIAPQTLVHPDGENIFLLATSSQKQSGGLYIVSQVNLMYGDLKLRRLHHNTGKGALLPPILTDITSDGVEDIIAAMFNSTIMAYDGLTFNPIWNYTIPNSEVISIPIPGYYNDDDVPDFMVKHQIGAGFPTYYYTVATIIDGRTGKSLLEKPIEDSLSRQMSGLSITVDGFGNDWFLHWSADCLNYEGVKEKYQFLKGQSLVAQTRADLCKLRFNSSLTTNLLALSQHVGPPGISLYFSEDWKALEFNNSIDPRKEAEKYLNAHPGFEIMDLYADMPFVSPRIHKNYRKQSVFKHKGDGVLSKLDKYHLDQTYENAEDYKNAEKTNTNSNFGNRIGDDFNVDDSWRRTNKWTEENVQANKEYDEAYDNDNGNNGNDEQSIDYSQADEVREQRSNNEDNDVNQKGVEMRDNFHVDINNNESELNDYSLTEDAGKMKMLKEIDNYTSLPNFNMKTGRGGNISYREKRDISKSTEKIKELINEGAMISLLMKAVKRPKNHYVLNRSNKLTNTQRNIKVRLLGEEPYVNKRKNLKSKSGLKNNHTIFNNITNNAAVNKSSIVNLNTENSNNTKESNKTAEQIHVRKRNFSNIIQNDEDANIEQIFKRESLKNQNKVRKVAQINAQEVTTTEANAKTRAKRAKREAPTNPSVRKDVDGIQRQPPTGILLPSIIESKGKTSIDLVFSTFWLPSSEISVILLQEDLNCIHRKKALAENKAQYKEDGEIISECLLERGVNYKTYQEAMDRENVKIALGQMTVYRMKIECACPEDMLPNQTCRNISPHQSWPEHLGSFGNAYFKSMHKPSV